MIRILGNGTFKIQHSEPLSLPQTISGTGHSVHWCCLQSIQEAGVLTFPLFPVHRIKGFCFPGNCNIINNNNKFLGYLITTLSQKIPINQTNHKLKKTISICKPQLCHYLLV